MAAAYRSIAGTTYASRTNTTISAPSGTADGDELRMFFILGAANVASIPTPTFPGGWSTIGGPVTVSDSDDTNAFSVRSWLLRKRASSEGADYTVTHSAASSDGVIVAASGGADANGQVSTNSGSGTGDITLLSVTTSAVDALVLAFCHNWQLWGGGTAPGGTTPTFTERQDSGTSLIYVATGAWAGSGATGDKTKDSDNIGANDKWSAFLASIEAAGAASSIAAIAGTYLRAANN